MDTPPASLAALAPTLAALVGAERPGIAEEPALAAVLAQARRRIGRPRLERCLVWCPDALGQHLRARYAEEFEPADARAHEIVLLHAPLPPVTPVSFATMFTGASPARHGIRRYEKPVLTRDTLFDSLSRAGRSVALIAVAGSSMATIFGGRALDYHLLADDAAVVERTLTLLEADAHALIVAYVQDYDDALHAAGPFSSRAEAAFRAHLRDEARLHAAAELAWAHRDRAFVVAPDHGAHVDPHTGLGDHGLPIPEDLEVRHTFTFGRANAEAGRTAWGR